MLCAYAAFDEEVNYCQVMPCTTISSGHEAHPCHPLYRACLLSAMQPEDVGWDIDSGVP